VCASAEQTNETTRRMKLKNAKSGDQRIRKSEKLIGSMAENGEEAEAGDKKTSTGMIAAIVPLLTRVHEAGLTHGSKGRLVATVKMAWSLYQNEGGRTDPQGVPSTKRHQGPLMTTAAHGE
jgi:hypothetical protein